MVYPVYRNPEIKRPPITPNYYHHRQHRRHHHHHTETSHGNILKIFLPALPSAPSPVAVTAPRLVCFTIMLAPQMVRCLKHPPRKRTYSKPINLVFFGGLEASQTKKRPHPHCLSFLEYVFQSICISDCQKRSTNPCRTSFSLDLEY